MMVIIYRVSIPRSTELGRDPATGEFEDLDLHPEAERVPGVCVYRFELMAHRSSRAASRAQQDSDPSDDRSGTATEDDETGG